MTDRNPPPRKPKLLLDENGNPVINKFGYATTAPLTREDEQAIDALAAKGYTKKAICEEIGVSQTRLKNYLEEPKKAQAIALVAYTQTVGTHNEKMEGLIANLVETLAQMEKRLTDVQNELKQVKAACGRNKIGREKLERSKRSQRQELTRLKHQLHMRTGRKP